MVSSGRSMLLFRFVVAQSRLAFI